MQRFYIENFVFKKTFILDDKELLHQILTVLRSRIGDYFCFFDWKTFIDRIYKLSWINKNALELKFVEEVKKNKENMHLVLFQATPNKIEKIEYIIQKWTEIWITSFVFFRADRSQRLVLTSQKIDRLKKIIIESSEQSGRNLIPEFYNLDNLDFSVLDSKETLFFHTNSSKSIFLKDLKLKWDNINIIIWPEWWWSDQEIINFHNLWFKRVNLWSNIMRCETVSSVVWFYLLNR